MTAVPVTTRDLGDLSRFRSPDHPITGSPDLSSRMSAITRDHGDLLDEAKRQFIAAKDLYLEAKRRYLMVREFVRICHILRMREESRHPALFDNTDLSLPNGGLGDDLSDGVLRLQKLKELIRIREIHLRRQQRAHRLRDKAEAAQRRRQDPELMENLRKLRMLRELVRHQERILRLQNRGQNRALAQRDYAFAAHAQRFAVHKRPAGPQPKPEPIEEPLESQASLGSQDSQGGNSCKVSCRTNTCRSHTGSLVWLRELRRRQQNLQGIRKQGNQSRQCRPRARRLAVENAIVRGPPLRIPHSTFNRRVPRTRTSKKGGDSLIASRLSVGRNANLR